MLKTSDSEMVHDLSMTLGEGPRWIESTLHWVDIEEGHQWRWVPGEGAPEFVDHGRRVVALAPASGGLVLVTDDSVELHQGDGRIRKRRIPGIDARERRLNDARVDSRGRLWVGSMSLAGRGDDEALYRLDTNGLTRVRAHLSLSNGIAFSPDGGVMYHADTLRSVVTRTPVEPETGELGDTEIFVSFADGLPDGLATDAAGNVWVALWGGGRVECYRPEGTRATTIRTPEAEFTTALCFGENDLRTMYITTATDGRHDSGKHAGALFRSRVEVPGLPETGMTWVAEAR